MSGGHVRAAGERLDVQRLRVLPIDPVSNATENREIAQVMRRGARRGLLGRGGLDHREGAAA
jgi:hypothetical protein